MGGQKAGVQAGEKAAGDSTPDQPQPLATAAEITQPPLPQPLHCAHSKRTCGRHSGLRCSSLHMRSYSPRSISPSSDCSWCRLRACTSGGRGGRRQASAFCRRGAGPCKGLEACHKDRL